MFSRLTPSMSAVVGNLLFISGAQPDEKSEQDTQRNFTKYVDPYIATGFHGIVFPCANVLFGTIQLGSTTFRTRTLLLVENWF